MPILFHFVLQELTARIQSLDAADAQKEKSGAAATGGELSEEEKKLNDIEDMYAKVTAKYRCVGLALSTVGAIELFANCRSL